jgi:hypothetical protein
MPKQTKSADNRPEIREEPARFPWGRRLPHGRVAEHPTSLGEFRQWSQLDELSHTYLAYLSMCDDRLTNGWLKSWVNVFAVGPFVGRKRRHKTIPLIVVANYRRPYRHLLKLSELLADVYLEFLIFPDLYLLPAKFVEELEQIQNAQWIRTKMVSIRLAIKGGPGAAS